jgi:hypothetical protein
LNLKPSVPNKSKFSLETGLLVILSVSFLWVFNYTFDQSISHHGDNATYYLLGESIASGNGYTNVYSPKATNATHFPPGYPAIIAGSIKLFGPGISGVKLLNYAFLFGSIILLFFIIKKATADIRLSFVVAMLCIFNPHLLEYATIMMSEIAFLFFLMLGVLFLQRVNPSIKWRDPNFWLFLLCLVSLYYIRSIGIAILTAACCYFLFSREWKMLLATVISILSLTVPWSLRVRTVGGGNYMKTLFENNSFRPEFGTMDLTQWPARVMQNAGRYITKEIPVTIFPKQVDYNIDSTPIEWLTGVLIVSAIIYGLFKIKSLRNILGWYCLGTMSLLMLWPQVWLGPRFIIPIIPIFLLGFSKAIIEIASWVGKRLAAKSYSLQLQTVSFAPLFLLLFSYPQLEKLSEKAKEGPSIGHQRYYEMAEWAKNNLPEDAVVACRKPTLFYLFSQRKVVRYKFTTDPIEFFNHLERQGVTHLVFDELGFSSYDHYLLPAANYYSGKVVPIYIADKENNQQSQICQLRMDIGYFGERKNLLKHGFGKFSWADGRVYQGSWRNNREDGFGILSWSSGQKYEGEWLDGSISGRGTLTTSTGEKYIGNWENWQRNGHGILYDAAGDILEQGIWENDELLNSIE